MLSVLIQREEDLFSHKNRTYFVFSKSGYTQEAQKFAQGQQLHLITFQQMVQDLKKRINSKKGKVSS
ncbi:hypothetical protein U1289_11835, partial [Enterococcus cecorum]|nr:hypothetical protein [Enterococcus cecorum]